MKTLAKALLILSVSSINLELPVVAMNSSNSGSTLPSSTEEPTFLTYKQEPAEKDCEIFYRNHEQKIKIFLQDFSEKWQKHYEKIYQNPEQKTGNISPNSPKETQRLTQILENAAKNFLLKEELFNKENNNKYFINEPYFNINKYSSSFIQDIARVNNDLYGYLLRSYFSLCQEKAIINEIKEKNCFILGSFDSDAKEHEKYFENKINVILKNKVGKKLLVNIISEFNKGKDIPLYLDIHSEKDKRTWAFNYRNTTLKMDPKNITKQFALVSATPSQGYLVDDEVVYLFHELLHWYHSLREGDRFDPSLKAKGFYASPEVNYFFFNDDIKQQAINIRAKRVTPKAIEEEFNGKNYREYILRDWGVGEQSSQGEKKYSVEEVLTVLGKIKEKNTIDTTELSENAFRFAGGYGIRISYIGRETQENLALTQLQKATNQRIIEAAKAVADAIPD